MKEELLNELKEAMKNKDEIRKNTITMLRASILQVEKDTKTVLDDDKIKALVSKEVKKRRESIEDYIKGDRKDIVEQLEKEIEILSKYLPEQLSKEKIENLVDEAIKNSGALSVKDMGKVMQIIRPLVAGKADGKTVSDIVREKLTNI